MGLHTSLRCSKLMRISKGLDYESKLGLDYESKLGLVSGKQDESDVGLFHFSLGPSWSVSNERK